MAGRPKFSKVRHDRLPIAERIDPSDVVLTFGKHKGSKLGDVHRDYVRWLAGADKVDWLEPKGFDMFKRAAVALCARRGDTPKGSRRGL